MRLPKLTLGVLAGTDRHEAHARFTWTGDGEAWAQFQVPGHPEFGTVAGCYVALPSNEEIAGEDPIAGSHAIVAMSAAAATPSGDEFWGELRFDGLSMTYGGQTRELLERNKVHCLLPQVEGPLLVDLDAFRQGFTLDDREAAKRLSSLFLEHSSKESALDRMEAAIPFDPNEGTDNSWRELLKGEAETLVGRSRVPGWFAPDTLGTQGDAPSGDRIEFWTDFIDHEQGFTRSWVLAAGVSWRTRNCSFRIADGRPMSSPDYAEANGGAQPFNVFDDTDIGKGKSVPYYLARNEANTCPESTAPAYREGWTQQKNYNAQHLSRMLSGLPYLICYGEGPIRRWALRRLETIVQHLQAANPIVPQSEARDYTLLALLEKNRAKPHQLGSGGRELYWRLWAMHLANSWCVRWSEENKPWIEAMAELFSITTLPNGISMSRNANNQNWTNRPFVRADETGYVMPPNVEAALSFQVALGHIVKAVMSFGSRGVQYKQAAEYRSQLIAAESYLRSAPFAEMGSRRAPHYTIPTRSAKQDLWFSTMPPRAPGFEDVNGHGPPSFHNDPGARAITALVAGAPIHQCMRSALEALGTWNSRVSWRSNLNDAILYVWYATANDKPSPAKVNFPVVFVARKLLDSGAEFLDQNPEDTLPPYDWQPETEKPQEPPSEGPGEPLEGPPLRTVVVKVKPGETQRILLELQGDDG